MDYERTMDFEKLDAVSKTSVPLKVKVPDSTHRLGVALVVRCETCLIADWEVLYVNY
jgi:hypothetical protein